MSVRFVCGLACAIALSAAIIPSQASALSWSPPTQIDVGSLSAISCPSVSLCVAVDRAGNVVTSSDPSGGSSAWTVSNIDGANALNGTSCPSVSLCVAVGGSLGADVVTSTDPTGGASAWTVTRLDDGNLTAVSCPSTSLCVAVDNAGNAVTSTDPPGGARAWARAHIDSANRDPFATLPLLSGISCPSVSLCVTVDNVGNAIVGTVPPPIVVSALPTPARIKVGLRKQLSVHGKSATIESMLEHGYSFSFTALSTGRLTISWDLVAKGAHLTRRKPKRTIVATAKASFVNATILRIKIKLTRKGRHVLRHAKHIKLTAQGRFTPAGHPTVLATRSVTLTR